MCVLPLGVVIELHSQTISLSSSCDHNSGQLTLKNKNKNMSTDADSLLNISIDNIEWIEQTIPEIGFRVWHVIFLCFSVLLTIVILICCCVKIRIPRTKQEIEADYQRKKIVKKFRERLRLIQNQDMDNMDLKLALERVQVDFDTETRKLGLNSDNQSNILFEVGQGNMKAEPQQPIDFENATRKLSVLMSLTTKSKPSTNNDLQLDDAQLK